MLNNYNLTSRQFIIGGITLFVLMLVVNLALPMDSLMRAATIFVGVMGLVLAVIFLVRSRPQPEGPPPEEG
jgi:phosphate starvation-inducible membrane PsiE